MVQSVNFSQNKFSPAQNTYGHDIVLQNYPHQQKQKEKQNISFGESYNENPLQKLKYSLALFTNTSVGLLMTNVALWKAQDFVNGKILVDKINKHFTKNLKKPEDLIPHASKMIKEHDGLNGLKFNWGHDGQAFYNHAENRVVTGVKDFSSVFHEIGHAVIENKTKFLKKLQRGRNNYTLIALALYTFIAQRPKNIQEDKSPKFEAKIKNFLNKNDYAIPLIAYSPELITEFMASKYGLDFLKKQVKEKKLTESVFKNIKKSYITCFSTYLFIPVSIILLDMLRKSAKKTVVKHNQQRFFDF